MNVPANLEAEESVLGAMMVSQATIPAVERLLEPEHFYRDRHRTIFQAILKLFRGDRAVDVLTVTEELSQQGTLDDVGGKDRVASLAAKTPAPGSAFHYARIVFENALMRGLDGLAKRIQQSVVDRDGEPAALVDIAVRQLGALQEASEAGQRAIEVESELAETRAELIRIVTAYERLANADQSKPRAA